jgi:hypothetical protein
MDGKGASWDVRFLHEALLEVLEIETVTREVKYSNVRAVHVTLVDSLIYLYFYDPL